MAVTEVAGGRRGVDVISVTPTATLTPTLTSTLTPTHPPQLKQSQLGQAVAFLSKCPDETPANRRLAGDLVTRWMQQLGVGASRGGAEATGRVKVGEVTPEERARQARAYEAEVQRKLREIQAAKPKVGDEEYRTRAQPPKVRGGVVRVGWVGVRVRVRVGVRVRVRMKVVGIKGQCGIP